MEVSPDAIARLSRSALEAGITWDNHGCMPLEATGRCLEQLERYRRAGFNVVSINISYADMQWTDGLPVLSYMRSWIARHPEEYGLISTVDDIARCKADHKLGVVFDIESMFPVLDHPPLVQTFYELGVRWMLITYNRNNRAGGGCLDNDGGLTPLGRTIIDEMARVGMVLCLSHTGHRTVLEAIEYSSNPVIFSHSNPYGDTAHPRNIPDALIQACARTGGVVGISGFGPFLGAQSNLVDRLLVQLRYVMNLVGPDHVGLGLDYVFDRSELDEAVKRNPGLFPVGFDRPEDLQMVAPESLPLIAEALVREGLSEGQIRNVLGENWLRIAQRVWR